MRTHARKLASTLGVALLTCSLAATGSACGDEDGGGSTEPDEGGSDAADVTDVADATGDPGAETGADSVGDLPADPGSETDPGPDATGELPPLPTRPPLAAPADPLAGTDVESCALYEEERCEGGTLERCEVYDTAAASWVDEPDTLLRRVLLFDRWRDLYNSPDGQAIDRDFVGEVLPGTSESAWGDPSRHAGYWGAGDGGIWTGWSTVASILRYSQTGTEADYQRMEQQVRDMVTMYDVTGIPGYLCRNHYLLLPDGAPNDPDHNLRWEGSTHLTHHHRAIPDPESIPNLPAIYTEGITDADGKVWKGTPMWQGRPSIDQNTGPMTSLPMAYGLLRDEELKGRIAHHLTCYLKRLQRVELINLQSNPDLLASLMAYFNLGELQLDPDDIDFTKMDRIVGYVHRQINTLNEDTYDTSCPDTVQLEPWRVIDATSPTFFTDLLAFIQDMDVDAEREQGIDHFYFPSLRGGDAMHMMHLATMAYYFTGDDMYRELLFDELIGNLDTIAVAKTTGAFNLPKYCKKYYGDQITYGPWWAFLHLLGESELRTEMQKAFAGEMWDKLVKGAANADFEIMYAGAVPDEYAPDKADALAEALDVLDVMGGNGGALMGDAAGAQWLEDPRRSYTLTPEQALAGSPGVVAECPTEAEVAICSAEIEFMGVPLPNLTGWGTHPCTGSEWDCEVTIGQEQVCTEKMASKALMPPLRPYTDYLWQRNPFELGRGSSPEGRRQFAGSDLSVPYWNARRYGFITEGAGQVLAWHEGGACGE